MANEDRRICCVEGFYEYEDEEESEPTIRPMLDMLSQWHYWPHVYTKCGTLAEAKWFLGREWRRSAYDSVLLFSTHGDDQGNISFGEGSISLSELGGDDWLGDQCEGCLVHFSACYVLKDKTAVADFLRKTGAAAVSGYGTDVGWAEYEKPGLLSDLMLLNALWEAEIDFSRGKRTWRNDLKKIECALRRRFDDCEFEIKQRE